MTRNLVGLIGRKYFISKLLQYCKQTISGEVSMRILFIIDISISKLECPESLDVSEYSHFMTYKRALLACTTRLEDTLCPPKALLGRLGSH